MLDSVVLLLNQNYEPITTCSARRAIVLVWNGKAEIIEKTGQCVYSVSMEFTIPSVIRLLIYVKVARRWDIQLTKQNIIGRDHKTCQYCGGKEGPMTVDHVIPRSHGGEESWTNLVCACSLCNNKKGDRTPEEAGLKLIQHPKKPNRRTFFFLKRGAIRSSWRGYLKIG